MDKISYAEMLTLLNRARYQESDECVSITFLTCDRKRKQGGEWRTIERAQTCGLPYSVRENEMRGVVDLNSGVKTTAVHLQLIFEINGKRVFK
ncbi:hypothetical protein BN1088_1431046 [Sphingobacterium sp. PM2-P1-29]|jgi:hypothetical protein|nr:hypothetical protein BN1088_1431046 [Sphingobacterium sp. PM2-P1-29]